MILLDSNCCKDSIFPHTSCYETWGSWERFDFWFIDVKHGSNMDHRTLKLESWQLVPRPPTPWRLAFVNTDLWWTSTSRIDVLGRPKYSGICWTSLRNLETKTLSHNAIGTSWLTFVEIIHLQLPPKHHPLAVPWYPWGWLPLFCANNSMTSPAAPCWPRISAWNSLTILVGDWLIHSIPLYLCTYHCTNRKGRSLRGVHGKKSGEIESSGSTLCKTQIPGWKKALPDLSAQFPNKNHAPSQLLPRQHHSDHPPFKQGRCFFGSDSCVLKIKMFRDLKYLRIHLFQWFILVGKTSWTDVVCCLERRSCVEQFLRNKNRKHWIESTSRQSKTCERGIVTLHSTKP